MADSARKGSSRFFLRVAQAGQSAKRYDEYTAPLFPLPLIMDAEGLLAKDARHLARDE